ncbi:site-specific DNA-methyltransferase (adenine-specific) [Deinococcus saxicola]|uniref:type ISP restriction/modification enzyme n=2 Tax=Deinococcus saxicola TaxID=249406 RepID=UPI0039EF57B7
MSLQLVKSFQKRLEDIVTHGGTRNESSVRAAFQTLLSGWAEGQGDLRLIPEAGYSPPGLKTTVRPDGTLKDALQQAHGYWESKDADDTLDDEIQKKFALGYPRENIIFEDSQTAVLIQHSQEVMRADMADADALNTLLGLFFAFEPLEVTRFREAIEHFRAELPGLLDVLRGAIADAEAGAEYRERRDSFIETARKAMNPAFGARDAGEMLIQHILTGEIFQGVFDNAQYLEENNIAQQLQKLAETFYKGKIRRDVDGRTKRYYGAIKAAASKIADHHEKQKFLKVLYETFYRAYNPAGADKLGIFYTPGEIVRFMIEATDTLLGRHFKVGLEDKGVEILDPATGTGTFITELIDYLPRNKLAYKYAHELHCNELALLPYYIANLNIEATYEQKMGHYAEFQNIVLVDTLDNTGFGIQGEYNALFQSVSAENLERVQRQNARPVRVIIGNPPYRANQANENDNNKNREYPRIDKRIKDTYIAHSRAQKTKLYDMYARFLRWATDRLKQDGIVAFVSNSSFVDAKTFDGFREVVAEEFTDIYVINMRGNANTSGERRKREGGNVFNDQIKVGVAVYFLIRTKPGSKKKPRLCEIHYHEVPDCWTAEQKKAFLRDNKFWDIDFERIRPDDKHNWVNLAEHDWEKFLPVAAKETKAAKSLGQERAIFKEYAPGIVSARDEWVTSLDAKQLEVKMKAFVPEYELGYAGQESEALKVKWSRNLKSRFDKKVREKFSKKHIRKYAYRPYSVHYFYNSSVYLDEDGSTAEFFPEGLPNLSISWNFGGNQSESLATDKPSDFHFTGDSQCLPLYRYKGGERIDNITNFALKAFRTHFSRVQKSGVDRKSRLQYGVSCNERHPEPTPPR